MMSAGPWLRVTSYLNETVHPASVGDPPSIPFYGTSMDVEDTFCHQGYLSAPNRYAYGERRLVIHSPRVGPKSYGSEKR